MQTTSKTSNFLKAINKYAAEQRKEIKTQAEEFRRYELHKAEAEVLRDAYYLIQKEMAQMKKGIAGEVSRLEMQKRREMLERRRSIMNEVFEKARDRLLEFVRTDEYPDLMRKYAGEIAKKLKKAGTVLYVCSRDEELMQDVREAFGKTCDIMVDDKIQIGGIRAVNQTMSMIVDQTLDSALDEQKNWFEENSGLNVF